MRRVFRSPKAQPPPNYPVAVDWSHPLAQGLIGCYLSTAVGRPSGSATAPNLRDLSGAGSELGCGDGTSVIALRPIGIAAHDAGAGASSGWQAPCTTAQRPAATASGFFVGYVVDGGSIANYPLVIGVTYANSPVAPFDCFNIRRPSTDASALSFSWNVAGTQGVGIGQAGVLTTGGNLTAGFTLNCNGAAGSARLFVNGAVTGTATATSGTISYNTPQMCFNGLPGAASWTGLALSVGHVWGRTLSDAEMAWLNAEPYAMLRPVVRRRVVMVASAAPPGGGQGARAMVLA